ncbi:MULTISPECIES: hypothetical protein [unclassified Archaeoglobus]|jgi:uncharacterized coiled-coil protein SlyX|uniref:hypothetical protein n=1 Tax=unclassified Archaeoglobus TaxID=2643606 RepID=UPI0025C4C299|nr:MULTISPECIES: hypothetical protein [unclassified Archaeoglobus]
MKVVRIEVQDWVDDATIEELLKVVGRSRNSLEELEKLLDELPERRINIDELKKEHYEAKMLY